MDLIVFDMTLTAGESTLIDDGYLTALDDPAVREFARRFGDDVDLLENWPD
ncbi:MAG: hypothetical protein M5U09_02100 [Gammaproteobacteria bacterium]|nr:hypothetical protein [Gammaproteobacteria bacterium]